MKKKSAKKNKPKISKSLFILFAGIVIIILTWLTFTLLSLQFASVPKNKSISNKTQKEAVQPLSLKTNKATSSSGISGNNSSFKPQVYGNQLRVPILMYHYVGNNPNPSDLQ